MIISLERATIIKRIGELGIEAWILLIRFQVVRRSRRETQNAGQAIMAFEDCDRFPLATHFL